MKYYKIPKCLRTSNAVFKKRKTMSKRKESTGNEKIFFINYKSMRHMQIWGSMDIKTRYLYLKER